MYKYHCRPGYKSENLLIECFSGPEKKEVFFRDLLSCLKQINARADKLTDLWTKDEILVMFSSDYGELEISKDIYGNCFILSDTDQRCIIEIDKILEKDPRFEKVAVDFNLYR